MNKLLLFDVDGTIAESSKKINPEIKTCLDLLHKKRLTIGIVGGGKIDKILSQIGDNNFIEHYFSECGSVYHKLDLVSKKYDLIYCNNIQTHKYFHLINNIITCAKYFLSMVDYNIIGKSIDVRNGLIYISLIGMDASDEERETYIKSDKKYNYRSRLLGYLDNELFKYTNYNKITICEGGTCGIAIYPSEYDKVQVLKHLDNYNEIHFFGDKYDIMGNDHKLINHHCVIGHKIDQVNDTKEILLSMLNEK